MPSGRSVRQICTAVTGASFDIDGGQQLVYW
jgi:hypothetical protein